jgi:hypothetical protein
VASQSLQARLALVVRITEASRTARMCHETAVLAHAISKALARRAGLRPNGKKGWASVGETYFYFQGPTPMPRHGMSLSAVGRHLALSKQSIARALERAAAVYRERGCTPADFLDG